MFYKEVIELVTVTTSSNAPGDVIETCTKRQVYADKQAIRQSEFYQAAATGLRPEIMFIIRKSEYNNEPRLEHNSTTYTIIRTYAKNEEFIELICQGLVNDAGA